jgi:predicted RNase H-like HicB family nuclease
MRMKKRKIIKIYEFPVVVEKDEDGYFFALVPSLQGCYTQGTTLEEALKNIRDVIKLHLKDRLASKEAIPIMKPVSLSSVEVEVKV